MTRNIYNVGETFKTNTGCEYKIIDYLGYGIYMIEFQDEFKHVMKVRGSRITEGKFRNPYLRTHKGRAFVGVGEYDTITHREAYSVWEGIWVRLDNEKYPYYINCTISPSWHNFQNFAKFYYENEYRLEGFAIDKDILSDGNKIYSAETCVFVPAEINTFFTAITRKDTRNLPLGVSPNKKKWKAQIRIDKVSVHLGTFDSPQEAYDAYKSEKLKVAKSLAEKWNGLIDPRVYEKLVNFNI